jgi:hypothetical protein
MSDRKIGPVGLGRYGKPSPIDAHVEASEEEVGGLADKEGDGLWDEGLLRYLEAELEQPIEAEDSLSQTLQACLPSWRLQTQDDAKLYKTPGDHVVIRMISRDQGLVHLLTQILSLAQVGFKLEISPGKKSASGIVEAMATVDGTILREVADRVGLDGEGGANKDLLVRTFLPTLKVRRPARRAASGGKGKCLMLVHDREADGIKASEVNANLQTLATSDVPMAEDAVG